MLDPTIEQDGVVFLDQHKLWLNINHITPSHDRRLATLLDQCDVPRHSPGYYTAPRVMVSALGSFPIRIAGDPVHARIMGVPISEAVDGLRSQMGFSGMASYLNPQNRSPIDMHQSVVERHTIPSTAHTASMTFCIAGLSLLAEMELCCQRDIVHLSRLTSARTAMRDDPPILLRSPSMLPVFQATSRAAIGVIADNSTDYDLDRETINSMWPLAQCSVVSITGSIKNLIKLSAIADDTGKEDEVRLICYEIGNYIGKLFPEFPHDE